MLISRGSGLCNIGLKCIKQARMKTNVQTVQHHGSWAYRMYNVKPERTAQILADCVSSIAWWWLLWHVYHDYHLIIGEEPFPDASLWTDEELGIPPDDAD